MTKLIRPTYPTQFSVGLLILLFIIAFFLSHQIFEVPMHEIKHNKDVYLGMFLAGSSVIIMILIVWEEILFPIKVKLVKGGMVFRNFRTKLMAQLIIYSSIPAIYCFIYFYFDDDVNHTRFFIWAAICMITPAIEKIFSGINNYNDFLRLTSSEIEYKNNKKEGCYNIKDIKNIEIIEYDVDVTRKIRLLFQNNETVTIDLDEMELDAFYDSIQLFITTRYKQLLKVANATAN